MNTVDSWPKILLFKIHTACYAKSKYSLLGMIARPADSYCNPNVWQFEGEESMSQRKMDLSNSKNLVCNLFLVRKLNKSMIKQHYSIWLSNSSNHPFPKRLFLSVRLSVCPSVHCRKTLVDFPVRLFVFVHPCLNNGQMDR